MNSVALKAVLGFISTLVGGCSVCIPVSFSVQKFSDSSVENSGGGILNTSSASEDSGISQGENSTVSFEDLGEKIQKKHEGNQYSLTGKDKFLEILKPTAQYLIKQLEVAQCKKTAGSIIYCGYLDFETMDKTSHYKLRVDYENAVDNFKNKGRARLVKGNQGKLSFYDNNTSSGKNVDNISFSNLSSLSTYQSNNNDNWQSINLSFQIDE